MPDADPGRKSVLLWVSRGGLLGGVSSGVLNNRGGGKKRTKRTGEMLNEEACDNMLGHVVIFLLFGEVWSLSTRKNDKDCWFKKLMACTVHVPAHAEKLWPKLFLMFCKLGQLWARPHSPIMVKISLFAFSKVGFYIRR